MTLSTAALDSSRRAAVMQLAAVCIDVGRTGALPEATDLANINDEVGVACLLGGQSARRNQHFRC